MINIVQKVFASIARILVREAESKKVLLTANFKLVILSDEHLVAPVGQLNVEHVGAAFGQRGKSPQTQPEVAARVAEAVGILLPGSVEAGLEGILTALDDEPSVLAQDRLLLDDIGIGFCVEVGELREAGAFQCQAAVLFAFGEAKTMFRGYDLLAHA